MVVEENEDEETTRMRKRWRNGVAEHGDDDDADEEDHADDEDYDDEEYED